MRVLFTPLLTLFAFLSCLSAGAATFTSAGPGMFNVPGTWTVVGADANGIPDNDDDIIINHAVSLDASSNARNITINGSGSLNTGPGTFVMLNWGSLVNNGSISGSGSWQFRAAGTYSGNTLNPNGSVYFYGNYSIAAGVTMIKNNGAVIIGSGCTVTNNGVVALNSSGTGYMQFVSATSRWINASGANLQISANFVGNGILTATAAPNHVNYKGATTSIKAGTYYNISFSGTSASTKVLSGAINVLNNFTIGTLMTLNCNNFNISVGGNWTNNANTTVTNQNTITFTGSGTQTITRAIANTEFFNNVTLNGSGTVLLQDSIRVNGNLEINSGTLDVNTNNFSVRILRDLMDNSVFNTRQGTVFMVGSTSQTIDGISTTSFFNLTTNNASGVTVNFTKQIRNILRVDAGAFGPSIFGAFELVATGPTTCARIAPLGATASLTGTNWRMQMYINGPASAYWQYLGTPMQGTTLNDWDQDARFYMSGVGGNEGTACCPTFFSVRTYNTTTNTYSNVTSVNTALVAGRGYMVWMSDNMTGLTSPLIFDTRGTPNNGTINRAVVAGGSGAGYNLVSNPMPCPVTYSSVVAASSATLSPNFLILQENGSYATNPNSGTIATSQGFMCIATTSGNITFTEACKSTTANPNIIRQIAGNEIRIKAGNQVNGMGEETVVKLLPGADARLDYATDLPYLASPYDNATHIWTQNADGDQFILNALGTEEEHLMIPLNVTSSTPGIQTLTFKDLNTVTEYNCAWLEDLTTGQRINLNAADTYQYDEAEMGTTRNFILHFERTNNCTFDLQSSEVSFDAQTNVFVSGNQLFAQFEFETEQSVTIGVYDLSGRLVSDLTTMNVGTQTVALENPGAHGIYLVRIQSGDQLSTKKIYY